jgi:hypothetical protein
MNRSFWNQQYGQLGAEWGGILRSRFVRRPSKCGAVQIREQGFAYYPRERLGRIYNLKKGTVLCLPYRAHIRTQT